MVLIDSYNSLSCREETFSLWRAAPILIDRQTPVPPMRSARRSIHMIVCLREIEWQGSAAARDA
jgi:hypothetical protein